MHNLLILCGSLLIFALGCMPKGVLIKDPGIWGKFYKPEKVTNMPILYLGGSDGGIDEYVPPIYAEYGHPVLSLGYFYPEAAYGPNHDVPEFIPREMDKIPLELIGKGIDWLSKTYPEQGLIVASVSLGGIAFLAFASTGDDRVKKIKKAVLLSGGGFCFEGVLNVNTNDAKPSGHSNWTYKGKELPFIPFGDAKPKIIGDRIQFVDFWLTALLNAKKKHLLDKTRFNLTPLKDTELLFISGENDKMAPSVLSISWLLEKYPNASNIEFVKLKDAGHFVTMPHKDEGFNVRFGKYIYMLGDTSREAATIARKKIGQFLDN
jgi:pimeloyl-ACP methyl ester carboxylesterase